MADYIMLLLSALFFSLLFAAMPFYLPLMPLFAAVFFDTPLRYAASIFTYFRDTYAAFVFFFFVIAVLPGFRCFIFRFRHFFFHDRASSLFDAFATVSSRSAMPPLFSLRLY